LTLEVAICGLKEWRDVPKTQAIVPVERIESRILLVRGHKVMLDSDLAELYGVQTKVLVQAVKRNVERFPADFMFRLSKQEFTNLRSQFVTSSQWGGRRYPPYAFTEHGAVMLASVLNSPVAVQASVEVVRAFIRLREILATHRQLARKLTELEQNYDEQFKAVFDAIRELMAPPKKERKQIGFQRQSFLAGRRRARRTVKEYNEKVEYIHLNPAKRGLAKEAATR
jgi:phage regulator Rha-like protein